MRKLVKMLILFVVVMLVNGSLQSAAALNLGFMGSYWDPKDGEESYGAVGRVGVPIFSEHFELEGRVYIFMDTEDHVGSDLDLVPLDLGGAFHLLPSNPMDLYLIAGASYVLADSDRFDLDNETGVYAGGGLNYFLNEHFSLTAELLYRSLEFDIDRRFSLEDFDASGVTVNAGFAIGF